MKKIIAILMAMAMVLCLAVSVSAEETVLFEGSVHILADGGWWLVTTDPAVEHGFEGQTMAWIDDWTSITHVVFTCEEGPFIMAYRQTDGSWYQTDGNDADTYDIDIAANNVMVVADGTMKDDGSAEAIPEMMVALYATDGADYVIKYTIYGNAAEGAEPEAAVNEGEPEVTEPEAAPETNDAPAAPAAAPEAPATGLALAVVPAVIALAAAAVTKRR